MKVSRLVSVLVLGAIMVSFLMMPSAALRDETFSKKCSCSTSFDGIIYIGEQSYNRAVALIYIEHSCEELTSHANLTVWEYTTNENNYVRRSYSLNGENGVNVSPYTQAHLVKNYNGSDYNILGVEATVRAYTTCGSTTHTYRYFEDDGFVPMSVTPPVVTE